MNDHKNRGFLIRLRYALQGLAVTARTERSFKTQLSIFAATLAGLVGLRPAAVWWALFLLASAGVFAAELFNTALERLADHLHPELHAQIRIVKDCAAAGVLMMALGSLAVAAALLYSTL